jgi:hypothetical protein
MEEQQKNIFIGVVVLLVILIGAGVVYWYYQRPQEAPPPMEEPKVKEPSPLPPSPEAKGEGEKEVPPQPSVTLPGLNQSDEFARPILKNLSPHGKIADWSRMKNLIRVITATVDNIANGVSPRPHLGFLSPGQAFAINPKGERIYLDAKGYERYDIITDAFASLSATRTIQAYEKLKPIFQEAYRELGYPQKDFQKTLIQAIQRLLETPVVEREILLKEEGRGINYLFIDDSLEELNEAQKHLLRMGPRNTRKIQQKLREMALALGVPENQLPQPRIYIPKAK